MTALAGLIDWSGRPDADRLCVDMLAAQLLYGGAGPQFWHAAGAAIGRDGHPNFPDNGVVVGGGGALVLTADMRLDNRDELAAALGGQPDAGDAALLMRALERWDEDAAERLVGEFAFALWDARRRRLLLARDYLGQRPLHLIRRDGFVAFASMPQGLHALADVNRAPDLAAAADFLAFLPDASDASFFEGVGKVPPGAVMTITADASRTRSYWNPRRTMLRLPSSAAYHEAMRAQMDRATAARLHGSGGRVAAQLSGGLDSSTVTATAARLLGAGGELVGYTSVPAPGCPREAGGRILNESALAGAVAALYPNINHVEVSSSGRTAVDIFDRTAQLYQRPALNGTNEVWLGAINDDAAARGLRVMLHGSMGNLGFSHTGTELLGQLLARGRWLGLARNLRPLMRNGGSWPSLGLTTLAPFLPMPLWRRIARRRGAGATLTDGSLLRPDFAASIGMAERARARGLDPYERPPFDTWDARVWALRRADLGSFTKGVLGGWGLELRDPTADRRLIEFCLSLTTDLYLAEGEPRALARRAFADRLPPAVARERRKGLQAADWHVAFMAGRDRIVAEAERIAAASAAETVIDTARLVSMARAIPARDWDPQQQGYYGLHFLMALSAGHFLRFAEQA